MTLGVCLVTAKLTLSEVDEYNLLMKNLKVPLGRSKISSFHFGDIYDELFVLSTGFADTSFGLTLKQR